MESAPNKDYDAIERAFLAYKGMIPDVEEPGPEWFNTEQFAAKAKLSRRRSSEILRRMVGTGALEPRDFKVSVNSKVCLVRYYRNL